MNLYFVDQIEGGEQLVAEGLKKTDNYISQALDHWYERYPVQQSYYQRQTFLEDGSIWIDVGSHTKFYILRDEN